jgi:hypothetical protein
MKYNIDVKLESSRPYAPNNGRLIIQTRKTNAHFYRLHIPIFR